VFIRRIALSGSLPLSSTVRKPRPLLTLGLITAGMLLAALTLGTGVARAQNQTLLDSDSQVNSVACPATGGCAAVGSYEVAGGEPLGLLLAQTSGLWSTIAEAKLPADANTDPNVNLAQVSCGSTGNCSAVGNFVTSAFFQEGLLVNLRAGTWRAATQLRPPADAAANPQITLSSISCASAGNCSAVGSYTDQAGQTSALALTETSWSWGTGQSVTLPDGAGGATPANGGAAYGPSSGLTSVVCKGVGDCTAVGWYTAAGGSIQGLLLTETAGIWQSGVPVTLPSGAAAQPNVTLNAVSCASVGNCTAVGEYEDANDNEQGLLLTEAGGVWGVGIEAPLPSNADTSQVTTLDAVSCPTSGDCMAVGSYTDVNGSFQGLLLTESGGVWAQGTEAAIPANAAKNQKVILSAVTCTAYETCVVGGTYMTLRPLLLLLTEDAGRWKLPIVGTMPSGAAADPFPAVNQIACATHQYCVLAGQYVDAAGNGQGVLIEGDQLFWRAGLIAPLPGAPTTDASLHKQVARRRTVHKNTRRTAGRRPKKHAHGLP